MMLMGFNGGGLGDWTDALSNAPVTGDLINFIQGKAKAGAEQAIPDVQAAIQPYVVTALLLGFGGFLFGLSAFLRVKKKGL